MKKKDVDGGVRKKTEEYIVSGKKLIKEGLSEEWEKYVKLRNQDYYSSRIIDASINGMRALSEGEGLEKVIKIADEMELTLHQKDYMTQAIVYFHPKGEEYRIYWNEFWVGEEEAKKVKKIVSCAFI